MNTQFFLIEEDKDILNRGKGCLLGLAIGDAVGTSIEFEERDSYTHLTDMIGGGPFDLNAGEWTDDTSMALCLGYSLINKGFDLKEQIENYCDWYINGYCSSNGRCFDIGIATRQALDYYRINNKLITDTGSNAGNGSIMRLAPVVLYFHVDENNKQGMKTLLKYARLSSITTHPNEKCQESCAALAILINRAINKKYNNKEEFLSFDEEVLNQIKNEEVKNILAGSFKNKQRKEINSYGYVLDSLEAALWSFYNTSNFKEAILTAANLGHDADTVAAICGQIAGAYYSKSAISPQWIKKIKFKEKIEKLAEDLMV